MHLNSRQFAVCSSVQLTDLMHGVGLLLLLPGPCAAVPLPLLAPLTFWLLGMAGAAAAANCWRF